MKEGQAGDFQAKNDALVGMTEDGIDEDDSSDIQRKNHWEKCSECGKVHNLDAPCPDDKHDPDKDNKDKEDDKNAGGIMKKNHHDKGMKVLDELGEAEDDFKKGNPPAATQPKPPKTKRKKNWRDDVYRDLGMKKVRGSQGGTYYEGEGEDGPGPTYEDDDEKYAPGATYEASDPEIVCA